MDELKDPLRLIEDVLFLKKNPIFSDVGTEELKAIAAIAEDRTYEAESQVVREGAPGESLFLVKQGSVRITKIMGDKETELAVLPETSCFGEMVLFEDAPRSASCYAQTDCLLMVIGRSDLLDVIQMYPRIAIQLFKVIGSRLRTANDKVRDLTSRLQARSP